MIILKFKQAQTNGEESPRTTSSSATKDKGKESEKDNQKKRVQSLASVQQILNLNRAPPKKEEGAALLHESSVADARSEAIEEAQALVDAVGTEPIPLLNHHLHRLVPPQPIARRQRN